MNMKQKRKRLGDLLVESGLITEEQLEQALKEKSEGQKLGDALLQKGFITEQQLIEVLEFQLGIPHVSLYQYPIDSKLMNLIPKDFAKRNSLIPLKRDGEKLFVAMSDPMDYFAVDDLRLTTGFQIETVIATKDDIVRAINRYYEVEESINFDDIAESSSTKKEEDVDQLTDEDAPIVKLVNQLLTIAVQQRASDIHIDPHEDKVVIRYRVDGVLKTERTLSKNMQNVLTARIKIMSKLDITETRIPQDGRIKKTIDFHPVDLRISTLPTIYGEKIVMRILDLGSALADINKLGFNKLNYQRFLELIERPNGIVLITGPTGSGKSTTLYAALNRLNREDTNIITVEDPVEYQLAGINQVQVNSNVGMTFAKGLRAILRQDPNIVMVGEIRDQETAEIAIRASLTGHLVLSTLHTNDAILTITRLIDMGVEPFLVASSLAGVVSQRLVRRICRDCIEELPPSKSEINIFQRRGIKIDKVYKGRGCGRCNMTGYKGRMAVHELLTIDDPTRRLIMNHEPMSKIREQAIRNKMIFLLDDGLLKVKQGLTTTEEILKIAISE
ncbi:type II secretory pathway, ATPase PulE/Tfp pilus assembly pathway, ATPase PilB [Schinkia azotoformans MEV2011]|uniref:Type II secretory pathway, ATPase PulE/Tfp pilus assembly pathway, ATPase PilB n=1 Tax=Schinkia azotoformans MEV2011 TaxID=1348973 RepID=A0A072NP56_SCHAZ|nr:ATPase, T2SS/T4P/T4SS family [Schinkia azotoformans]KEF39454.1 type II secretory pathway, ATPase PulE/Tfp pilus assembly pathway, ATPase PilB [Schinkia azotoformans MEV2011]MEC1696838.1 ATPase, T2SS/T4P/T4SS family [Schinkia azotoformans]MEC1726629.1 ATPase, T2SS/T4P/T4SS family [Schinkia azotoformans]MEC1780594.1 ATPase, T2SS/T4P/T4SS family [Schinkia azotoformans]MED4331269.1 ATPase, T2SS/T4P/T4SS family [Schinkia azotoformans]